jgi:hypothetical protein
LHPRNHGVATLWSIKRSGIDASINLTGYAILDKNCIQGLKKNYKHSTKTPIHTTGQGSCASPAIWLLVGCLLMDCLLHLGNGKTLKDMLGTRILRQVIDGFVDDTSLFTNLLNSMIESNNIAQLTTQLRYDMIAWKELLEASGRKLELTKCFYYILTWKFDTKGNPHL